MESVESSSVERNVDTIPGPFEFEIGEEEEEEEHEFEEEHFEQSLEQISEKVLMEPSTTGPTIKRGKKTSEKSIVLDDNDVKELWRSYDPSYRNLFMSFENPLVERMKNFRSLFKSELEKIIGEQISAYESTKVRRLYKTGINLPHWIFLDNNTRYTFREVERLRFLLSHEVL